MAKLVNHAAREQQRLMEEKKKRNRKVFFIALACILAVLAVGAIVDLGKQTKDSAGKGTDGLKKADTESLGIDMSLTYYADIEIENYGTVTIELDQNAAPVTVDNFVTLAESGFYDGLTFHRIIEGFMMQGGDPLGNGTGGSDKTIIGEFSANGYDNNLSHTRGAISMARSSQYDSASSQFFIVHKDSSFLDGQYAAFGYVTEGMDVVDSICESVEPTDGNGTISAQEQPVIRKITIRAGRRTIS